jgi:hypothetical protein
MDALHTPEDPLVAAYAESVELEKSAWQELHSHPPGSPERMSAWRAWSEAISRTNDAWRRLSARRFATPGRATSGTRAVQAVRESQAASHAGA